MTRGEKPYRVYRGGRVKGKVPALPRPDRVSRDGRRGAPAGVPGAIPQPRRRPNWGRRIGVGLLLLVVALAAFGGASYWAVDKGVDEANARLDPRVPPTLAEQHGLLLGESTTILLLGTDHARNVQARAGSRRSDSIMLVHVDSRRHRLAYLSVPRDLRVDVPGQGSTRINAAMQAGGPALAVQTVRALTGIPVNHVVVVDFSAFEELIDAIGGITVNVPRPVLSGRFDCPYATPQDCRRWEGWRFGRGPQEMNGRRALIYSRVRVNRLDTSESDVTRGERQQAVLQALMDELTSPKTLVKLPFVGEDLLRPLTTDLTTAEFMQLAWQKFRFDDDRALHCRLGGSVSQIGGQAFLIGTEENVATVHMVLGATAPQPPLPGSGPFGPGCVVGSARLSS
jgi:LCP family protein required for cell wall assembly